MFLKSDNCTYLPIVDSIALTIIEKHSMYSRHSWDNVILRECIVPLGMFMEERKIAL